MKKIVSGIFALMLAAAAAIPAMSTAESVAGHNTMYVVCDNGLKLNVRSQPTKNSKVLYRVANGKSVKILHNEATPSGWAKVQQNGKTVGYVMTKFLHAKKPGKYELTERADDFKSVTSYTVKAKARAKGTTQSVGLRTKPNKTASAIRRLQAGDKLKVIAVGKTWSKVVDLKTGKTGYVANSYIAKV